VTPPTKCPNCKSANIKQTGNATSKRWRCFNCGQYFNPRFNFSPEIMREGTSEVKEL